MNDGEIQELMKWVDKSGGGHKLEGWVSIYYFVFQFFNTFLYSLYFPSGKSYDI